MRVLITRPQEAAVSLAKRLEKLGCQVIIDPLIHLAPISPHLLKLPPLSGFDGIVTTSPYAIRCLANLTQERSFPLWCVGMGSAQAAQGLGFQTIHTAAGSAENLVETLCQTFMPPPQKPFLHVSGDTIQFNVAKALQKQGIAAQRIIVYETQEATAFSGETQYALKANALDAVLFYSPRTARVFRKLCQVGGLGEHCAFLTAFCLSDAIRAEISSLPWKNIQTAKKTSTAGLLMVLMRQARDGSE